MMQQFLSRSFFVFLLTGGTAAAINFGSRIFYNLWLDFSTSIIFAYITGMITAFALTKIFVFRNSQLALHRSAIFFILVNVVAILQTWAISMGLTYYVLPYVGVTKFVHEISHAVGVVAPVFSSYVGHKRWSFQ